MIATGGIVAAVHAPTAQAAGGSMFNCQSGYIYSMQANGTIKQIDPSGTVSTTYATTPQTSMSSANGLGINTDGSVAYWYERTGNTQNISKLVKYSSDDSNSPSAIPQSSYTSGSSTSLVTGAVDSSNRFLFASFNNSSIYLWQGAASGYNSLGYAKPVTVTPGQGHQPPTTTNDLPSGSLNGDMAFDSLGNLYVVSSTDPYLKWNGPQLVNVVDVNITLIKKSDIDAAIAANSSSRQINSSTVSKQTITAGSGFNGIAFDSDGYVYVGNSTTLLKYDPTTWNLKSTVTASLGTSTDLSSCSTPPTLEVVKNLPNGRAATDDQFTLNIADSKGGSLTSETTTGNVSGIQRDTAGPAPVVAGNQYIVSETTGSDSTDLSKYTSSLACVDTANGNATVAVDSGGKLIIPKGATKSPSVVCTFTNAPKPQTGALTITKAFDSSVPTGAGTQTANTVFSGTYSCAFNGTQNAAGTWSRTGTGNATLTKTSGADPTAIPNGSSCSAVETQPSAGSASGLPASWVWGTPQISGSATITAPNTSNITVTNKATQQKGALAITKVFDSSVPSGATGPFSGKYTCSGTSLATATGSWTVNGQGAATLTADQGSASPTALPAGLSCTVTETSPASGSTMGLPNSYVWGTPTISSAVTISVDTTKTVTVTNKATHVMGSVSWNKTDESGHALAGSEWTITPTNPSGAPITVVDNGVHDADSVAGALKVTGLDVGTYSLQESKAPAGYVRSDRTYTFTISVSSTTATVNGGNAIENEQQTPPTLPLTGGLSTDAFIIGGGGLIVLSVAIALIMRRRKAVHV
jgi:LPXTG-motif cell wall-anchored protein